MEFKIPEVGKPYVTPTPAQMRAMERPTRRDIVESVALYGQRLREQGARKVYIYPVTRAKKGYATESLSNACAAVLLEQVLGSTMYRHSRFLDEYVGERLDWCLMMARERGIEVVEVEDDNPGE